MVPPRTPGLTASPSPLQYESIRDLWANAQIVRCWGSNSEGQLGDGTTVNSPAPVQATGVNDAADVSVGREHACVRTSSGAVQCWGDNLYGQLGTGNWSDSLTPAVVNNVSNAAVLTVGANHTCVAYLSTAVCWGQNNQGQLGNGGSINSNLPVNVAPITNERDISAGYDTTCTVLLDGTAWCWGNDDSGQLGNATNPNPALTPVQVSGLTTTALIGAGEEHTCAVVSDGSGRCWGLNYHGQLGNNGVGMMQTTPVVVTGLSNAVAITSGNMHSCALLNDGTVVCWGSNTNGQIGDGTNTNRLTFAPVLGLTNVAAVEAGSSHSCAVVDDGTAWCWGYNANGQLGDGTTTNSNVPVQVVGL